MEFKKFIRIKKSPSTLFECTACEKQLKIHLFTKSLLDDVPQEKKLFLLSVVLSGGFYSTYKEQTEILNFNKMNEKHFYKYFKKITKAVDSIFEGLIKNNILKFNIDISNLRLKFDAGWSHRGHNAGECSYAIYEATNNCIFDVLTCNSQEFTGKSGEMESFLCEKFCKNLIRFIKKSLTKEFFEIEISVSVFHYVGYHELCQHNKENLKKIHFQNELDFLKEVENTCDQKIIKDKMEKLFDLLGKFSYKTNYNFPLLQLEDTQLLKDYIYSIKNKTSKLLEKYNIIQNKFKNKKLTSIELEKMFDYKINFVNIENSLENETFVNDIERLKKIFNLIDNLKPEKIFSMPTQLVTKPEEIINNTKEQSALNFFINFVKSEILENIQDIFESNSTCVNESFMRSRLKWCPKTRNTPKQFNTRSKFAGLEREDPHWKSKLLYKLGIHIPSIQILSENKRWAKKKILLRQKRPKYIRARYKRRFLKDNNNKNTQLPLHQSSIKKHNKKSRARPYFCQIKNCRSSFSSLQRLITHQVAEHNFSKTVEYSIYQEIEHLQNQLLILKKEKLTKEKQKNRADGGGINRCSGRRKDRGGGEGLGEEGGEEGGGVGKEQTRIKLIVSNNLDV
ncbi:hypothetical protein M0813_04987 [Anaeramoeba flamelloides]|uniref:C2H2-type domain-containing protein n=1 Tax=Anaeramoeba flamelloides TaxID=1746091 RepID=A0ABQ8XJ01_9EUKA|nr:hypothetical protein M0813_04987 [Anaeramoeba flamelloides]